MGMTSGRGFCLACHGSYSACMNTQLSAVGPLIQASSRMAISALISGIFSWNPLHQDRPSLSWPSFTSVSFLIRELITNRLIRLGCLKPAGLSAIVVFIYPIIRYLILNISLLLLIKFAYSISNAGIRHVFTLNPKYP